jgi:hypothetical protein
LYSVLSIFQKAKPHNKKHGPRAEGYGEPERLSGPPLSRVP